MKKIIGLLLPLVLIVIGIQFTRDYFGDTRAESKERYENLISEGEKTTAKLASQYKETTIKIAGLPVKLYEVEYTFSANGKKYSGSKSLQGPPSEPLMQVTFLPSDPNINAINPSEELSKVEEHENSSSTLYIGLGLLVVGLLIGYYRVKSFRKPRIVQTAHEERKAGSESKKKTDLKEEEKNLENKKTIDSKNTIEELKKGQSTKKDFEPSDHSKFMPKS